MDPTQDQSIDDTTPTDISAPDMTPVDGSAEVLINMEGLIKNHIAAIDRIQDEMRKHKSMLDDIFANDPTFAAHDKTAKEAAKVRAGTKGEIMKRPQVAELAAKVKGMKTEINELEDALSDYLQEYQRLSGVNEIEGEDGQVREIVYTARLIKRSFKP